MKTRSPARTAGEYAPTGLGMSPGRKAGCHERCASAIVHSREEGGRMEESESSTKRVLFATPTPPVRELFPELETPVPVVDLDRIERKLERAARYETDDRIALPRPLHTSQAPRCAAHRR